MSETLEQVLRNIGKETVKGHAIHLLAEKTTGTVPPAGALPNAPSVPTDLATTITAVTSIINVLKARGFYSNTEV